MLDLACSHCCRTLTAKRRAPLNQSKRVVFRTALKPQQSRWSFTSKTQGELTALGEGRKFWGYVVFLPLFLLVSVLPLGCTPGTQEECVIPALGGESMGQARRRTVGPEEHVL